LLKRKPKSSKFTKKFGRQKGLGWKLPALNVHPAAIAAMVFLAVFLAGGGLYLLFEPTLPAISIGRQVYPIVPSQLTTQTLSESLLAMIFLFMGVGGGYMIWSGLQSPVGHRPSTVKTTVGIVMLIASLASLYILFLIKFSLLF